MKSEKEKMLAGELYDPLDKLRRAIRAALSVVYKSWPCADSSGG